LQRNSNIGGLRELVKVADRGTYFEKIMSWWKTRAAARLGVMNTAGDVQHIADLSRWWKSEGERIVIAKIEYRK